MSHGRLVVRPAAVADAFYPADRQDLEAQLSASFAGAVAPPPSAPIPKAIVVPHAGLIYSGPVAASAYRRIAPSHDVIRHVVLLGPSHRVALDGFGVSGADAFETPLGLVPIDAARRARVVELPAVRVDDAAHELEHSLEVQLPFLQSVLDEFELLPLVVGEATPTDVGAVLDACWGGSDTLIVVSTDLSHYLRYDEAVEVDARTAAAIASRRLTGIDDRDACGSRPLRGLLHTAVERGLEVEQLDVRNSGDTAGGKDRVVGYGAFALT